MLTAWDNAPHPGAWMPPAAADSLGITALTLLVIRPDAHVGLRAERDHLAAFAAYRTRLAAGH